MSEADLTEQLLQITEFLFTGTSQEPLLFSRLFQLTSLDYIGFYTKPAGSCA